MKVHKSRRKFKGKMNTLVSSRERLDLFVSSLLINLSQVLSPWTYAKFGPNHVKLCVLLLNL